MRFLKRIVCLAVFACCLTAGPIPACVEGSFADYIALSASDGGCTVGILIYKSFSFDDLTGGFGPPDGSLNASNFGIAPNLATGGLDISIPAGTYFEEKYLFSYVVDPAPILGGEELSMDVFSDFAARSFLQASLTAEPSALASKWACPHGVLSEASSLTLPAGPSSLTCTITKGGPGIVVDPFFLQVMPGESDSVVFPEPVFFTHVRILFELDGTLGPLAVSSAPLVVPEPGTNLMLAGGLIALLAACKRRR